MAKDYIEKREFGYYVIGSRIPIDTIVYAFLNGDSAEGIVESFPALTLEQVHGSLAFYLANRPEIDAYLAEADREYDARRAASRAENPLLYRRLEQARRAMELPKQK